MRTIATHLKVGVSVVIPVFNGQDTLPELVVRLRGVLSEKIEAYEVILVNDGSSDNSWQTIVGLSKEYPELVGIDMMRNYGQHNALLCGVRAAQYDRVVTLDDDLQHPPEQIPKLLTALDDDYDVVYGAPIAEQHGPLRNFASRATKMAFRNAMGVKQAPNLSAFRVFRTQLRDAFWRYQSPFLSLDVLLTWGTARFRSIRVEHDLRNNGESGYTFARLLAHAFNMMTGFSIRPLQIASWTGFLFTLFGIAVLIYVVGRYLVQGGVVPGFAFLASVIAIFSGAQLFALGIIGEYLARMHFRVMDKPTYTVRDRIGHDGEPR